MGLYLLLGSALVFGTIGAAIDRGHRWRGLALGFIAHLIGVVLVIALRRQESRGPIEPRGKACPHCQRRIPETASTCGYCHADLTPIPIPAPIPDIEPRIPQGEPIWLPDPEGNGQERMWWDGQWTDQRRWPERG